jgi:glycyl-tRNA synthetase beta chain
VEAAGPAPAAGIEDFFRARLRGIFLDQGMPPQDVDAALAQGWSDPIDARARALACAKISKEAREVFKRIANILDDARGKKIEFSSEVDRALCQPVELALLDAFGKVQGQTFADVSQIIETLAEIQPAVAAFFDKGGVMVMDPDPNLRRNRLSLLNRIYERYAPIADFRKLGAAS